MYCRKVSDFHLPNFMMVVSLEPVSFIAMAPPARNEWSPMSDTSRPLALRSRAMTAASSCCLISAGRTCLQPTVG